jgi:hypothetical protein
MFVTKWSFAALDQGIIKIATNAPRNMAAYFYDQTGLKWAVQKFKKQ